MKFRDQGFTAISLTTEYIDESPNIWSEIAMGKYQIVLCAPEVVARRNGSFWRRIASTSCVFRKGCQLIVIDEAHLIWGWQKFREEFLSLGALRANFSKTPILVQSATLPPHIRTFVHKALYLNQPTLLSVETIDRPNIALLVAPQLNAQDPLDELEPFINEDKMLPTIIYVDNNLEHQQPLSSNEHLLKHGNQTSIAHDSSTGLLPSTIRHRISTWFSWGQHRSPVIWGLTLGDSLGFPASLPRRGLGIPWR